MSHDSNRERTLGLSPAQIGGSALSAVSAASVASWAGTTGTLIGAAVGSVVATIGAATYTWSLRRTSDAVRRTAAQVRATALINGPLMRTSSLQDVPQPGGDDPESGDPTQGEHERPARASLPWGKALIAGAAVAVASVGGITAVEAVTGEPLSALLGHSDSKGTSLGQLASSDTRSSKSDSGVNRPHDSVTPDEETATPSDTPTPTPAPTTPPATPQPSTEPSVEPTLPPDEATPPVPESSTLP